VIPSSLSWGLGDYHLIIITARRIIMKYQVFAHEVVVYTAFIEAVDKMEANRIADSGEVDWGHPVDGEFFSVVEVREV
jgi:hypothetical protein